MRNIQFTPDAFGQLSVNLLKFFSNNLLVIVMILLLVKM